MHQNNADLIRPGCRGGHDQFNWESLRTMKYHDREQYLGQTTIIGYLDKGGKWRKKDWYIKPEDRNELDFKQLDDEFKRAKEEDERRIRIALGLEQPDEQKQMQVKLTKEEMAQLTKKTKFDFDDEQNNDKKGLGNGPMQKQTKNTEAQYLLEAYGDQDQYQVQVKKEEDGCIEKKIKKEKKKKEKKEKKSKDKVKKEEKKHKKHKDSEEKKERKKKEMNYQHQKYFKQTVSCMNICVQNHELIKNFIDIQFRQTMKNPTTESNGIINPTTES